MALEKSGQILDTFLEIELSIFDAKLDVEDEGERNERQYLGFCP